MRDKLQAFQNQVNLTRFHDQTNGFYESFFLRANHPVRPLAFWIRYTLFSPKAHPEDSLGELWGTFFNGETNRHTVVKLEYPLAACHFDPTEFKIQIGAAKLSHRLFQGSLENHGSSLAWEMKYQGDSLPLLLLPLQLYEGKFPAAKSLVSLPCAHFNGTLRVNDEKINITDWVGSQNHNWGLKHTDLYAWGQVAGFDSHPESFLEVATAQLKLGPLWTPPITLLVLRHNQKEYALTDLVPGIKAHGKFRYFSWEFKSISKEVEIEGEISAPALAFVGLNYHNPPGGNKYCLNSKIAACRLHFKDKTTGATDTLETKNRAAFEILTSARNHGISISA